MSWHSENFVDNFGELLLLLNLVLKPQDQFRWLLADNADLGARPVDLIADGETDRVVAALWALAEGVTP